MVFLTAQFLSDLTGLETTTFPTAVMDYAEAQAKAALGYLEEEEALIPVIVYNSSKFISLDDVPQEVTKVEYRVAAGDFTEIESDSWRAILLKKLIILDDAVEDDTELQITCTFGWTTDNIPDIVMFYLAVLALDAMNLFQPGSFVTSTIDTKKIGDYMVKYHISGEAESNSIGSVADKLAVMIKQGSYEPTVKN